MKIEILYLSGCPYHVPAVSRVRDVLLQEGVSAELAEVEVKETASARRLGFLGSPSIRIDGQDIEVAARSSVAFGLTCRTYEAQGMRRGIPPLDWIRTAVREARRNQA